MDCWWEGRGWKEELKNRHTGKAVLACSCQTRNRFVGIIAETVKLMDTKNQINTFKTSVTKTQNYCISVNNEKSITEQSSPSNCFTCWLSRSCKRAKEEPKPKHTNT